MLLHTFKPLNVAQIKTNFVTSLNTTEKIDLTQSERNGVYYRDKSMENILRAKVVILGGANLVIPRWF